MKNWWKILGILIMIYVLTAGLLIPLKSGILHVDQNRLSTGATATLKITGYNSHFTNNAHEAFIKLKEGYIASRSVAIISDQEMNVIFDIPNDLPDDLPYVDATLVLINGKKDYSIYPSLRIVKSIDSSSSNANQWQNGLEISEASWRFAFPYRNILVETIRNTFFHVAIWMAMFVLLIMGMINSIRYLQTSQTKFDYHASSFTYIAVVYGIIGILTGSIWAKYTWGALWVDDVKLNMVAISIMIYLAYGVLRSSIDDHDKRAKSSAIYNIFAFVAMIPLIWIIPRMTSSLHPGSGGNPAFGGEDLDNTLRLVFYPAILSLILIGTWIAQLTYRTKVIKEYQINKLLNRTIKS